MLVFIAGLAAYASYVATIPFIITLINGMESGKTGPLLAVLETFNSLLYVMAMVGALLLLANAAVGIRDYRRKRSGYTDE